MKITTLQSPSSWLRRWRGKAGESGADGEFVNYKERERRVFLSVEYDYLPT
jgi:hypothetical protein